MPRMPGMGVRCYPWCCLGSVYRFGNATLCLRRLQSRAHAERPPRRVSERGAGKSLSPGRTLQLPGIAYRLMVN